MRPRYDTEAIVIGRAPVGEASALLHLLTRDFGLVRAKAQGIRKSGAKLAIAVQTFSECRPILVRGKDGWRLSGAVLEEDRFDALSGSARSRAGRVAQLLLRLVPGETRDPELFYAFRDYLSALPSLNDIEGDAAETLVVLRILRALGLDAGALPGDAFDATALSAISGDRRSYIARINRGITASGL